MAAVLPKGEFFVFNSVFKNAINKVLFIVIVFVLVLYPLQAISAEKLTVEKQIKILPSIEISHINDGWINIKYEIKNNKRQKVIIQKDDTKYTYDLIEGKSSENFPLQMGEGKYSISIYENTESNKYRLLSRNNVFVNNENPYTAFLASVQTVGWDSSMPVIQKVKELINDTNTTLDMITIVYKHILDEVSYDYKKMSELNTTYIPKINEIYNSKTGICYDFASLFAGMLRSIGIPAKLVKGYADNIDGYHAWNEVYIKETDEWITIDTSFDAQMKKVGKTFKMIKESGDGYSKLKEY
jgi:hypothetical protein